MRFTESNRTLKLIPLFRNPNPWWSFVVLEFDKRKPPELSDADMAVVAGLADNPDLQADIMQEVSDEWEQTEAERNLRRHKNDENKRARGTKSRAGKKFNSLDCRLC